MSIAQNIETIKHAVAKATAQSGRGESDVRLMAVSKFQSTEKILQAYNAGIRLFGENRVQELCEKFEHSRSADMQLHMIGSLQRNKVKRILPLVDCIQSVDRTELLHEIAKHHAEQSVPIKLLLEVHTAEDSKSGFLSEADVESAINYATENGLCVCGFMTMAPFTDDTARIRESFVTLRKLSERMQKQFTALDLTELSMGMSNDYAIAIEEGATLVRIGTAIFAS
ncbi:MAG: YggS family pyridoxal phosphate-dependent enzyme [Spirochaetales bacterium]